MRRPNRFTVAAAVPGLVLIIAAWLCGGCSTSATAAPAAANVPVAASSTATGHTGTATSAAPSASPSSTAAVATNDGPKTGTCVAFITSYDHSVPCKPGAELIAAILVPTGDSLEDAKACRADSRVAPYATVWPLHTADGQLLCLVYLAQ